MRVSASPFSQESQLRAIEGMIEAKPDEISLRFARACCLEDLGYPDQARTAYADVLRQDATHFGALTNLGSMFLERGDFAAARPYFVAAAAAHPGDAVAHINLGQLYTETREFESALAHFNAALGMRPDHFYALLGLGTLFERAGDRAASDRYLERAFAKPYIWTYPYRGTGEPIRVLMLASPRGGDLVSNLFFDERVVERKVLVPEAYRPGVVLPPHDLLFNVIGDVDKCRSSLERARAVAADSPAPVLNDPDAVLATARDEIMRRLRGIPGWSRRSPPASRARSSPPPSSKLTASPFRSCCARPASTPATTSCGSRAPATSRSRSRSCPATSCSPSSRSKREPPTASCRKYRVVFVDRRPYPLHLAISPNWKVHYFSSDMFERADHRDEEAAFLRDPEATLGAAAMRALAARRRRAGASITAGSTSASTRRATCWRSKPTRRWRSTRPAAKLTSTTGERPRETAIAAVRAMIVEKAR